APAERASSAVASEQLSAITSSRVVGPICSRAAFTVSAISEASLCAGMTTASWMSGPWAAIGLSGRRPAKTSTEKWNSASDGKIAHSQTSRESIGELVAQRADECQAFAMDVPYLDRSQARLAWLQHRARPAWHLERQHMTRKYFSQRRILVTGGAGFLGSHLIDR